MKVYVAIDKETWSNVAVANNEGDLMEMVRKQDVYYATDQDFYSDEFFKRYEI